MKKEANANRYFTLVQKALLFSMTSAFILVPGCNCGGEEEPAQAKLTITEPADKAEFTATQDEDPFTDGIQITVKVKVENEIEGQEIEKVSLANDQGSSIDAKVVMKTTKTKLLHSCLKLPSSATPPNFRIRASLWRHLLLTILAFAAFSFSSKA